MDRVTGDRGAVDCVIMDNVVFTYRVYRNGPAESLSRRRTQYRFINASRNRESVLKPTAGQGLSRNVSKKQLISSREFVMTIPVDLHPSLSIDADFLAYIDQQRDRAYDLHAEHLNPAFVKMLRTIGFDKEYVRGEGCCLWDDAGTNISTCSPAGAFSRWAETIPKVKSILKQLLDRDTANLVRMECSVLSGLVAEKLTETNRRRSLARLFLQQRDRDRSKAPSNSPAASPAGATSSIAIMPFMA